MLFGLNCSVFLKVQLGLARLTFPGMSEDSRQEKRDRMKDQCDTGLSSSKKVTTASTCTQTSAVILVVSLFAALMDCDLSDGT